MTVALESSPGTRVWPLTALLVLVGVVVQASALWNALIAAAPFFGDVPSRARYLESAASSLSGLAPTVAIAALGLVLGCRWGLLALVPGAALLLVGGMESLRRPGDPADPDPGRALRLADLGDDITRLSWLVAALAVVALVVVLVARRRQRQVGA